MDFTMLDWKGAGYMLAALVGYAACLCLAAYIDKRIS